MYTRFFLILVGTWSFAMRAQHELTSLDEWNTRIQTFELFPRLNANVLKYAAFGVDNQNWFDFRETPAVRYGLTINDSVDERRHPYLAALAYERLQKNRDCSADVKQYELPDAYLNPLISIIDEGHWKPIITEGPLAIEDIAVHSNATKLSWKRANQHLMKNVLPSHKTHLFVPSYEANKLDSLIPVIVNKRRETQKHITEKSKIIDVTVKPGESLSVIAQRERVSVNDIIRWNKLSGDRIYAGQKLVIRGIHTKEKSIPNTNKEHQLEQQSTHTVQVGESFWKIAQSYPGITADDIKEFNELVSDNIDIGQVLRIPKVRLNE